MQLAIITDVKTTCCDNQVNSLDEFKVKFRFELIESVFFYLHLPGDNFPEEYRERFVVFFIALGSKVTDTQTVSQDMRL